MSIDITGVPDWIWILLSVALGLYGLEQVLKLAQWYCRRRIAQLEAEIKAEDDQRCVAKGEKGK